MTDLPYCQDSRNGVGNSHARGTAMTRLALCLLLLATGASAIKGFCQ